MFPGIALGSMEDSYMYAAMPLLSVLTSVLFCIPRISVIHFCVWYGDAHLVDARAVHGEEAQQAARVARRVVESARSGLDHRGGGRENGARRTGAGTYPCPGRTHTARARPPGLRGTPTGSG